jgi:carbohydrate esterase-like sialic acid-specific acetylesterase/Calx-beta domain-containing protein
MYQRRLWRVAAIISYVIFVMITSGCKGLTVSFSSSSSNTNEATHPPTISVALSGVSSQEVAVDYAVTGGTATGDGIDYTLASGTIIIPVGHLSANITPKIVNDTLHEDDETVVITLSNPTKARLGEITSHTVTITDGEPDVWLALGQSNMVSLIGFTEIDIPNPAVEVEYSWDAEKWSLLSSQEPFSTVPTSFALQLNTITRNPIRIINAAQRGTSLSCWRRGNPCYEEHVRPFIDLPIRGIIWWQGETEALGFGDALGPEDYSTDFKSMIMELREDFINPSLPFIFVGLQHYDPCIEYYSPVENHTEPFPETCGETELWSSIREAQKSALSLSETMMVPAEDVTNGEVHPFYAYQEIAGRLAVAASAITGQCINIDCGVLPQ